MSLSINTGHTYHLDEFWIDVLCKNASLISNVVIDLSKAGSFDFFSSNVDNWIFKVENDGTLAKFFNK